jgi:hypothetical protein
MKESKTRLAGGQELEAAAVNLVESSETGGEGEDSLEYRASEEPKYFLLHCFLLCESANCHARFYLSLSLFNFLFYSTVKKTLTGFSSFLHANREI